MSTELRTRGAAPTAPAEPTPAATRPAPYLPVRSGLSAWWPTAAAAAAVLLSALCLTPLLADGEWWGWPVAILVAISATGGVLAQVRAPLYLVPLAQVVVGTAVMTAAFVPTAPWGFIPTPSALGSLRLVLQDGLAGVEQYAPPIPPEMPLVALITLGVGVCAMVTHVLAVSVRSPVLAGLPLAAMYAVPAATMPEGAPWWSFLFIVAGWLLLLVVDSRLQVALWGRLVPRDPRASTVQPRISGSFGPSLRLGALAAVVALVVPPLVPGITDAVLGGSGSGAVSDPDADPDTVSLDPFVSMRRDLQQGRDVEVFAYRTQAGRPAYLRTVVADSFDGEAWIPHTFSADESPRLSEAVVSPPGLGAGVVATPADYDFESVRLATPYLPLPFPVSGVGAGSAAQWRWDTDTAVAFSTETTTQGLSWHATGLTIAPTPTQLEASTISGPDGPEKVSRDLAARIPESLVNTAGEVTAGARTPYERALAIQWWLRNEFTYDVNVKGDPTADQLEQFLRDRVGYCQQFAATMALMARALGIPARVAVGYTPGEQDAQGVWHVTAQDAHAWPELLFDGVGWVPFEPTPRAAQDGGNVAVPAWARESTLTELEERRAQDPAPSASASAAPTSPDDPGAVEAAPESAADRARRVTLLGLLVVGLALAAVPSVVRRRRRHARLSARGGALAEGGWAELRDDVRDAGRRWSDAETPRQAALRLGGERWARGPAAEALQRLATAVERARYARDGADLTPDVADDLHKVRAALETPMGRGERWRVRLFPASALRRA